MIVENTKFIERVGESLSCGIASGCIAPPQAVVKKETAIKFIAPTAGSLANKINPKRAMELRPLLSTALATALLYSVGCKDFNSRVPSIAAASATRYLLDKHVPEDILSKEGRTFIQSGVGIAIHVIGEALQGKGLKISLAKRLTETAFGAIFNKGYDVSRSAIKHGLSSARNFINKERDELFSSPLQLSSEIGSNDVDLRSYREGDFVYKLSKEDRGNLPDLGL